MNSVRAPELNGRDLEKLPCARLNGWTLAGLYSHKVDDNHVIGGTSQAARHKYSQLEACQTSVLCHPLVQVYC